MNLAVNNPVIAAFTELAASYEATVDRELRTFWGLSYQVFVDQLVTRIPVRPGDLLLDLATGTAVIPRRLAAAVGAGGCVVGLDLTPAMLARARQQNRSGVVHTSTGLVCGSAMRLPFTDGLFDGVVCALGTHHMDVPCMLAEARRVLRDGGMLFVADVGASSFWRSSMGGALLRVLMAGYGIRTRSARGKAEIEAFRNVHTAGEWRALLAEGGLMEITIEERQARRPWFPSGLTILARAIGQGGNGSCQKTHWPGAIQEHRRIPT
jgi:ubiquinone/menaquinone biosynthesis C-methylase UbiE